jgi:hypothetical protein
VALDLFPAHELSYSFHAAPLPILPIGTLFGSISRIDPSARWRATRRRAARPLVGSGRGEGAGLPFGRRATPGPPPGASWRRLGRTTRRVAPRRTRGSSRIRGGGSAGSPTRPGSGAVGLDGRSTAVAMHDGRGHRPRPFPLALTIATMLARTASGSCSQCSTIKARSGGNSEGA